MVTPNISLTNALCSQKPYKPKIPEKTEKTDSGVSIQKMENCSLHYFTTPYNKIKISTITLGY